MSGLSTMRGFEWRRSPLGRIGLLDVVHEIESDGLRRARVERRKNSGLAVGGDFGDLLEARVAEQAHGHVAAFVHAAIFRGDGRLLDPFLQSLDGFVVALFDFLADGVKVVSGAAPSALIWERERGGAYQACGCGALEEGAAITRGGTVGFVQLREDPYPQHILVRHGSPVKWAKRRRCSLFPADANGERLQRSNAASAMTLDSSK